MRLQNAFKNHVFEASKLVSTKKTLLLKHYYRCQGLSGLEGVLSRQARKKSTKINFLGPETARWGGGLPLEGVVAENFVPALESLSSLGFEERIWDVPGILSGCPGPLGVFKKFVQKKFVRIFRSLW